MQVTPVAGELSVTDQQRPGFSDIFAIFQDTNTQISIFINAEIVDDNRLLAFRIADRLWQTFDRDGRLQRQLALCKISRVSPGVFSL